MNPNGQALDGGYLPRIPADATLEQTQNALNDIINRLNGQLEAQQYSDGTNKVLFVGNLPNGGVGFEVNDANGVPLALFGKYPDGTIALKVAKTNKDVTTAQNNDLVFNSAQNTLKVVKTGTVTLPGHTFVTNVNEYAHNQSSITVAHELNFLPAILAYTADGGFYTGIPTSRWQGGSATSYYRKGIDCSIDDTNIYFYLNSDGYNRTVPRIFDDQTIKYYLLQETAA